ncbi:unnamed protein product [Euphydryas editha]|uniref:Peptidase A2 domain-containing protein n=1 Tax=Euphydryas editha TaxID=104508 RepID=A0AAU9U2S7_EUPED|nr:unnamed protein product [Euphydryas editha]
MAKMETSLNLQVDLSSRIFKARVNFKKSPKERVTKDYVMCRLESLEQLWSDFRKGHRALLQQSDPQLLEKVSYIASDTYNDTEEEYMIYKCELKRHLPDVDIRDNPGKCSDSNVRVKLPKINIPTFSGKYTEWITFRDLFLSMIHNNTSLDNVQKLQYLKGFLTGEAEQLIRYIPVSDANYEQCWKMLEKRYSNKKYLSHCILKRLLSQKNATSESASFLKELIDTSSDCLNALTNLGINVSTWDIIVIHLLSIKLDSESRKQWELNVTMNVPSDSLPTFSQFKDFLTSRYRALEFIEPKHVNKQINSNIKSNISNPKVLHTTGVTRLLCELCGEKHKLSFCKKFGNLDCESRREFVTKNRICFNCLGSSHSVKFCQIPISCKICKKRHHSLLHPGGVPRSTVNSGVSVQAVPEVSGKDNGVLNSSQGVVTPTVTASYMACSNKTKEISHVLLATALVEAKSKLGQYQVVRALLDQGSQASFVTEATVQGLGLKKNYTNSVISGLGGEKSTMISKYMVSLNIKSRVDPQFQIEVKAYVLNNITTFIPGKKITVKNWVELENLCLADPTYHTPNKIDILLGAEVYSQILKEGVLRGPVGCPVAQSTALGWILSGPVGSDSRVVSVFHSQVQEEFEIKKFWELESEPLLGKKILTAEEQRCEDIFAATTRRTEDGKYIVRLPFRDADPACKNGESREIAVKRLKNLERKFNNDSLLKDRYAEVIREYLRLGHMELVQEPDKRRDEAVYLPHHAVIREDKSTSKVRVVFDASCKNKNGISLNDTLMVGPTLQPDLRHVILNWRKYSVCVIADIVKMYRMVGVADEDCDFQRIVWRDRSEDPIKDYRLLTVTFGTAPAPYLAVRTLNQVAKDYKEKYPVAASKVKREFYMDDLLTGCGNVEEGKELVKEMDALLKEGGFVLQKWSTNNTELLKFMNQNREQEDNKIEEKKNKELETKLDNIVKILGLTWNSTRDEFQYSVKLPPLSAPVTKRKIISDVARLYDPLGWIAPCVIKAKIFIQRLWIAGTGWDEEPPEDILNDWYTYRKKHPGFDGLTRVVSLKCKNSIIKRPTSKLIILPVCD